MYDAQAFNANLKLLGPDLEAWGADQRNLALRMCVHCADIANPAKPLPLALQWTERVVTEFFNQVNPSLFLFCGSAMRSVIIVIWQ